MEMAASLASVASSSSKDLVRYPSLSTSDSDSDSKGTAWLRSGRGLLEDLDDSLLLSFIPSTTSEVRMVLRSMSHLLDTHEAMLLSWHRGSLLRISNRHSSGRESMELGHCCCVLRTEATFFSSPKMMKGAVTRNFLQGG